MNGEPLVFILQKQRIFFQFLGGQFEMVTGGQFVLANGGQFKPVEGGQFEWIFQKENKSEISQQYYIFF